MIVLGLILLILGLLLPQSILTTLGIILIVVGLVLNFVPIGGSSRRVWKHRTSPKPPGPRTPRVSGALNDFVTSETRVRLSVPGGRIVR